MFYSLFPSNFEQSECIAYPEISIQIWDIKNVKAPYTYGTISVNACVERFCMEQMARVADRLFTGYTCVPCEGLYREHLLPVQQIF